MAIFQTFITKFKDKLALHKCIGYIQSKDALHCPSQISILNLQNNSSFVKKVKHFNFTSCDNVSPYWNTFTTRGHLICLHGNQYLLHSKVIKLNSMRYKFFM